MDWVAFVGTQVVVSLGGTLDGFKFPESLSRFHVDVYVIETFSPDHKNASSHSLISHIGITLQ